MSVLDEIVAERSRQISSEGWTPEHDDANTHNEMPLAAACYAIGDIRAAAFYKIWPEQWDVKWWKPTNRRRDLVKAGALIVAEIERLDRAASKTNHQQ